MHCALCSNESVLVYMSVWTIASAHSTEGTGVRILNCVQRYPGAVSLWAGGGGLMWHSGNCIAFRKEPQRGSKAANDRHKPSS